MKCERKVFGVNIIIWFDEDMLEIAYGQKNNRLSYELYRKMNITVKLVITTPFS
ncbi:MAG: hypothetical protein V3V70_02640 [Candidatus Scalindua sp.]